jgi:exonuclease III
MIKIPLHFGSWNMRGLNDPIKQKEVASFVRANNLSLFGLLEHKIREANYPRIINYMFPGWSFVHNSALAPNGRICVVWDPSILTLSVVSQSSQSIHCCVQHVSDDFKFFVNFVYGSNLYLERKDLWNAFTACNVLDPWIILGDFNALRCLSDKIGGDSHWPPHMEDFNDCIAAKDLEDLRYSGHHFTWSNKQDPPHYISTKIDRVLVNEQWIKTFTCSNAHFPSPGISDHTPAVVSLNPDPKRVKKPFKFFNFLAHHPAFLSTVQKVWRVILGNPMFVVCEKLKLLQVDLKKLNTKEFSDISIRTATARQELDKIQGELGQDPTNPIKQAQERLLCKQYLYSYC